jgi:hypothetical protein
MKISRCDQREGSQPINLQHSGALKELRFFCILESTLMVIAGNIIFVPVEMCRFNDSWWRHVDA